MTFLTRSPQVGQWEMGSSLMPWMTANRPGQISQESSSFSYSYWGMGLLEVTRLFYTGRTLLDPCPPFDFWG
jgi:hypothetical protein